MHTAGTIFDPEETLQLIHLTAEVMKRHFGRISGQHTYHSSEGIMAESASFLQTGSSWLRELTIDNMSNWSLINQLTTELTLNTKTHRQDDPITLGNCMNTLCLLSSTDEIGGKIRGLGGVETIIKLLPRQFSEERGEDASQRTWTLNNKNLRFTLRALRHLTEPDINDPYYPRIGTGVNLKMVLGALRAWGGDETTKGLTFQVLYNLMRQVDNTQDTPHQGPLLHPNKCKNTDLHLNSTGEGSRGPKTTTRAQGLLYRLETETHTIERAIRTLHNHPSHHHVTQSMGIRILQALTLQGIILSERTPRERDLKWSYPVSGTSFDTLPDLTAVSVNITYWHSHKAMWQTMEGTISVPLSGNVTQLIQMLLWNHPYIGMESFLQGMTAYDMTRGARINVPLDSDIRALGSIAQKLNVHLLIPHWETGHLDLAPRSRSHLEEGISVDKNPTNPEESKLTTWRRGTRQTRQSDHRRSQTDFLP